MTRRSTSLHRIERAINRRINWILSTAEFSSRFHFGRNGVSLCRLESESLGNSAPPSSSADRARQIRAAAGCGITKLTNRRRLGFYQINKELLVLVIPGHDNRMRRALKPPGPIAEVVRHVRLARQHKLPCGQGRDEARLQSFPERTRVASGGSGVYEIGEPEVRSGRLQPNAPASAFVSRCGQRCLRRPNVAHIGRARPAQ
jgi:hypothetical protein